MLAHQRQARILEEVRRAGGMRVSELTGLLQVSDMTVRRDIEQLASDGLVQKVHGGAVLRSNVTEEPGFLAKSVLEQGAKRAIAARAAELVRPDTAIAVSAGTTTWAMAEHLATRRGLTVLTNSTAIGETIATLGDSAQVTVILTGGVRTPSAALVGPVAELSINSLYVDQLFLGVHGMDVRAGLTTPNLAEAETNRALIQRARTIIVLADSTKWGTVGLAQFGALSVADVVVSDNGLPADARAQLADAVGELIIVERDAATVDRDIGTAAQ